MIPRFFCPFPIAPGAQVELPPETAHHAIRVLRLEDGDAVRIFDGRGGEWAGRLARAGKALRVVLESFDGAEREPRLAVTLVQALPSGDKMDWIVEKGVELGVSAIQPVAAKRSVVRLSGERMARRIDHWRQIAVAACEQCGRNRVPEVLPLLDLPQYLATPPKENETRWILAPGAGSRLCGRDRPSGSIALLIGPEGGFEEAELLAAKAAGFGPVSLGPRVLRTETAGAAALAAMMSLWGDF